MHMEMRALFGRIVYRGFWVQTHTEGVRTQPARTRFTAVQRQSKLLVPVFSQTSYSLKMLR